MKARCKSIFTVLILTAATAFAADRPGVVSNIKVLSDKIEDVSSIEAWKKSVIIEPTRFVTVATPAARARSPRPSASRVEARSRSS